ncbi:MAG: glycosyltransferase [Alphaproteobacteria bacterium]|nr:glycosyltransferase [Alphaproteobacteria bacterium]
MRIVLLLRSLGAGGTERQVCLLANGLAARGHAVTVVVFYRGGPLEADLAADVTLQGLGKRRRWDVLGSVRALRRIVRRHDAEVVYSFLPVANLLALTARGAVRGLRIVWGLRHGGMPLGSYDRLNWVSYRFEAWLARWADRIVVNSEAGRTYALGTGIPAARLALVANGIDTARFRHDAASRAAWRERWGVPPAATLIGLPARIDPVKGHRDFLAAAAAMAAQRPALRFVCIGGGIAALAASLRDEAGRLGLGDRLTWAGEITDMPGALSALDVACLASHAEGSPNTVAEAIACGVPCVVTAVGAAADIVGDTGLVVPPRAPDRMAAACLSLVDRIATGQRADPAAWLQHRFGADRMVAATEAVLDDVVARKAPCAG